MKRVILAGALLTCAASVAALPPGPPPGPPPPYQMRPVAPAGDRLKPGGDGKTLFAFWSGRLVPSACGAEIRGKWQPLAREGQPAPAESDFILRRSGAGTNAW